MRKLPSARGLRGGAALARFLRTTRDEILASWYAIAQRDDELRQLPPRPRMDHLPALLDHIASFAEQLAEAGDHPSGLPLHAPSQAAIRHALARYEQGFDLSSVVLELEVLCDCAIQRWYAMSPPGADFAAVTLLKRLMNDAVATSIEEYTRVRDRTLRMLDAVSSAAVEARSIDELLDRLLSTFASSTPVVDTAAILLCGPAGPLQLRAAVGLETDLAEHFGIDDPSAFGGERGFAEWIARGREPWGNDPRRDRPRISGRTGAAATVRALFGVPLIDASGVIGVAHMGSRTAAEFSADDRQLFSSMAARATSAIAQHVAHELARQREADLAASERRFRTTFAQAYVGIAHVSTDGAWLRLNPRYCEILGYTEWELMRLDYAAIAHPDDAEADIEAARRLVTGELKVHAVEKRFLRRDGSVVWVASTSSLVRDPEANEAYFVSIIEDISQRRAMEDALRTSRQRLQDLLARDHQLLSRERKAHRAADRSLRLRERVLAIVSHDLRNPLGAIRLAAAMQLHGHLPEAELHRHAELIDRSAMRMERMISDLLDMASIEAGRLSLDLGPHDGRSLLAEALEGHQATATQRSIELVNAGELEPVAVWCDHDRILQVLGNLIGNALKFCRAGDRIELAAIVVDDEIVFSVADTGPGIPPGELDQVFDPYWSSRRDSEKGVGLGLSISKGIVEAHGGRIGVRDNPPHGALFWFAIPREPRAEISRTQRR
ncbi:MAG: ATP-binding protein [Kofleriaceae bacterium]